MTENEKEILHQSFISTSDLKNLKLNISRLYNIDLSQTMKQLYQNVDFYHEREQDVVDSCGYHGIFFRQKKKMEQISWDYFIDVLARKNALTHVMRTIREID